MIVVVGAGVAGLASARELARAGLEHVVLEARDRIGGRIHTDRSLGSPVELGATWIHGAEGNPIATLAAEEGIRTIPTEHRRFAVIDPEHGPWPHDRAHDVLQRLTAMLSEAMREGRRLDRDTSVADFVRTRWPDLEPGLARAVRVGLHWLTLVLAAEPARLSAKHWAQDDDDEGPDLLLPDGYDHVVAALARGLDVRLGHIVHAVAHGAGGVSVETDRGTFRGDAAIITLPLGVLAESAVRFDPPLPPDTRAAIDRLGMGVLDKIVLRFERTFWPEDRHHLVPYADDPGPIYGFHNLVPHGRTPTLTAWTAGDAARHLESEPDEHAADHAMRLLRRLFGRAVPDPIAVRVTRWGLDPFTRGSYSHIPVGASGDDILRLATPVPPLYFAGEHTYRPHPATVHGAYLSALDTARSLIRELVPASRRVNGRSGWGT